MREEMQSGFDRKEIKRRGREAFRRNFWICVLVALILAATVDNYSAGNSSGSEESQSGYGIEEDITEPVQEGITYFSEHQGGVFSLVPSLGGAVSELAKDLMAGIGTTLALIGLLSGGLLKFLVINIIEIGGADFFTHNAEEEKTGIGVLFADFGKGHYLDHVKAMFVRDLQILLWTLLLIVPGVIKSYEYRMIPYLLAQYPDMDFSEAKERSRAMMDGNKMDAFVYDLSFIGWWLLSALTGGLIGIFWSNPYKYAADAELYRYLSGESRTEQWGGSAQ